MILPDVNVLVYAFRREADQHQRSAREGALRSIAAYRRRAAG